MVKKKGDLAFTVIHLPALYPTLDIISQISPVADGFDGTVCLNIAPQFPSSTFKQIDAFKHCAVENKALSRIIPENTRTIIINNLSFWILYCGLQRVYKELLQLSREHKVITTISHDTLDQETEDTILLLPDLILSLSPDPEDPLSGTLMEVLRQSSGRTEKKTQRYSLLKSESSFKLDISKIEEKPAAAPESNSHNITFELGLSEREKSARDATELPYTHNSTDKTEESAGHIHYVPDEVDDWDDEDPDDDLDI